MKVLKNTAELVQIKMKKLAVLCILFFISKQCFSADFFYAYPKFVPDGDTIVLTDKRVVRYIGIDSPEVNHDTKRPQSFSLKSKSFNKELVSNKKLKIVFGKRKYDNYKRILAYVYLPDGQMVNRLMVENGLAWTYWHKDNNKYFNEFISAQKKSMNKEKGLWSEILKLDLPVWVNPRSMRFHSYNCKTAGKKSKIEKNPFNAFYKGYSPSRNCLGNVFKYKN
jgi:micrococcal nuclease